MKVEDVEIGKRYYFVDMSRGRLIYSVLVDRIEGLYVHDKEKYASAKTKLISELMTEEEAVERVNFLHMEQGGKEDPDGYVVAKHWKIYRQSCSYWVLRMLEIKAAQAEELIRIYEIREDHETHRNKMWEMECCLPYMRAEGNLLFQNKQLWNAAKSMEAEWSLRDREDARYFKKLVEEWLILKTRIAEWKRDHADDQ